MSKSLIIHAARLFDGEIWHEDVTVVGDEVVQGIRPGKIQGALSIPLVVPGLVDCGVRPEGYTAGPVMTSTVREPEEAFVSLCTAYGVTSVVDVGSSYETSWWFRHDGGVNYLAGGPRVSYRATSRSDIVVEPEEVEEVVRWIFNAGSAFVSIEVEAASALKESFPRVITRDRDGTTLPGLVVERSGSTWHAPQLMATKLWSVDGLLNRGDCTEARAFLPYFRYFTDGNSLMGRRASRHILNRIYGDRPTLDGINELFADTLNECPNVDCLLASSSSGSPGLVPGRSLWEEMEQLELIYGSEIALRAVTGNASSAFPELNAGKITVGHRFDALLSEFSVRKGWNVSQIWGSLRSLVVGGEQRSISDAREDACNRARQADARKI